MEATRPVHYYYDNPGRHPEGHPENRIIYLSSAHHTAAEIAEHLSYGYIIGPVISPKYVPAGLAGLNYSESQNFEGSLAAIHIPHLWSGSYDPTGRTIHGDKILSFKPKLPTAFSAETAYIAGNLVSFDQQVYKALPAVVVASATSPDMLPETWEPLFVYNRTTKTFPMYDENLTSAIYVHSDALMPEEAVIQFSARFASSDTFTTLVGMAVNEPDPEKGTGGVTQGVLISISKTTADKIVVTLKDSGGTFADYAVSNSWEVFNGATGATAALSVPLAGINSGTDHTFKIVSNKGVLTLSIDGIKFGGFRYIDAEYPLRKYTKEGTFEFCDHLSQRNNADGELEEVTLSYRRYVAGGGAMGELVNHVGRYYMLQTVPTLTPATDQFSLIDLCFHRLHLEDISNNFSQVRNASHVLNHLGIDSDEALTYKGIKVSTSKKDTSIVPNRNDDTGDVYFYMGWEDVNGGWLVRRQTRATGLTENATTGAATLEAAWLIRPTLTYS